MVNEAFPSRRSFEEVVDPALDDLDDVGAATPVAEPGPSVPQPTAAVRRRLAVVQWPRRSRDADVCDRAHHRLRLITQVCDWPRPDYAVSLRQRTRGIFTLGSSFLWRVSIAPLSH